MLKQYHLTVKCRLDGNNKVFYYTKVVENGREVRYGAKYGCNDKKLCQDCIKCWMDVRKTCDTCSITPCY